MMTAKKLKQTPVQVRAAYLWAAAEKARASDRIEDIKKINDIFLKGLTTNRNIRSPVVKKISDFFTAIKQDKNSDLIPFSRNLIDILLAISICAENVSAIFKFFSDKSYVDLGYIRVRNRDIDYVDRVREVTRDDKLLPEFLSEETKKSILGMLDSFLDQSFEMMTVNNDKGLLAIQGDIVSYMANRNSLKCKVSVWNGPMTDERGRLGSKGSLSRYLPEAKLTKDGKQTVILSGLTPEATMELTAASIVGKWLLIESDEIRVFGQLPDLTEDNDTRTAAVDPAVMLRPFLLNENPLVWIPADAADYFSRQHKWFVPADTNSWLEAIAE